MHVSKLIAVDRKTTANCVEHNTLPVLQKHAQNRPPSIGRNRRLHPSGDLLCFHEEIGSQQSTIKLTIRDVHMVPRRARQTE